MNSNTLIKSFIKEVSSIGIVGGNNKNIEFGLMTLLNSSIFVKFQEDQVNLMENIQSSILSYLRGQQAQNIISEKDFFAIVSRVSYSPYLEDLKSCDIVFENSTQHGEERLEKIKRLENVIKEDAIILCKTDHKHMETLSQMITKKDQFFGIKFSEKEGHDSLIQVYKPKEAS